MSRIAIVTDSTAYLPPELVTQYGIHVIPVYTRFVGERALRDGVDLDTAAFYWKLRGAKTLPTTSQPSAGDFVALYRRLGEESDAIVSIHISSKLSGTVPSALAAREMLQAEAAERGDDSPEIYVVDSLLTSGGLGLLVTAAARLAATGTPAPIVAQMIEDLIPCVTVIFVVDTLEYLRKGGRIGGAAALLGSVIQIKPILYLDGGRIEVLQKVRTAKKAKRRLLEIMEERMGTGGPVRVAVFHADALGEAKKLKQKVESRFDCAELFVCEFSAAIATHVGPGTLALAFYR
jgi:DegV family protein with EDD domain